MRLFAALELSGAARATLAAWGRAAAARDPALRAVDEDALHVTLHFLGERPAGEVPRLREAIAGAPDLAIPLTGTGTLWLAPRRPHVLTCGLESPGPALAALHAGLGAALRAAADGWTPDARPLRPHVTVARVRRGGRPRQDAVPAAPALRCGATAVLLQRSVLEPSGARYETLERRTLRAGG